MRLLYGLLGIAMAALIVAAFMANPGFAGTTAWMTQWWGATLAFDVFLGFALFAGVIWCAEGGRPAAWAWIVPLFVLGNAVSALWMVLRWRQLRSRLMRATDPG